MGFLRERIAAFFIKKAISGPGVSSPLSFGGEIHASLGGIPLTNLKISTDSLYTIWRSNSDVFACIRELKENTGSNGYVWENTLNSDKAANAESVRLAESILAYNKTFKKLKSNLIQDVHISGNAYLLIQRSVGSGKIIGVQSVDPRTLFVVTDKYGNIIKWIQRVKNYTQEYQPSEICHWSISQDPNSAVFGFSPIESIIWEVRTDLSAMVSNYAFFENDAQPAAQYILDEGMGEQEVQAAVDLIQNQLKGADKRHKSVVLKGVKEIKTIAISPKDMEFSVLRKFTTEKVCAALGVPKSILNYTEDVNLANGQEQTRKFWEGTIHPLQEDFQEFINKMLLPMIGIEDIKLVFNERKFDTREWDESSNRADVQLGIMTINEAREARGYKKYDPNVAGELVDKPLIYGGLGVVPVEDVGVDFMTDVEPIMDEAQKEAKLRRQDGAYERSKSKKSG